MSSLVKVTSHVDPPYTCTYTLAEFIEANAEDLTPLEIASLIRGESTRIGGGAAPIVDVVPIHDDLSDDLDARVAALETIIRRYLDVAPEAAAERRAILKHFGSIDRDARAALKGK